MVTPKLAVQPLRLGAGLGPQLGVEIRERLVEEKDLGPPHQRPGQRHPLPLAAGEAVRFAVEQLREAEQFRRPSDAAGDFGLGHPAAAQAEGDVAAYALVRIHRVVLEDHRHVASAAATDR